MIKKQRLRKPCRVCGVYFTPTGNACKLCNDCHRKAMVRGIHKKKEKTSL